MKTRFLTVLRWGLGIAAFAASYAVFELPGLLISLFVGAVVVAVRLRRTSPLGSIDLEGLRIDFPSMKMFDGTDEYLLRRSAGGRWERRATSVGSVSATLARKRDSLSKADHLASLEAARAVLASGGGTEFVGPTPEVIQAMQGMAPGTEGRRAIRDLVIDYVRKASGDEAAAKALEVEEKIEVFQALQEWARDDNGGFEPVPMFDGPIETAYQRYIRQG